MSKYEMLILILPLSKTVNACAPLIPLAAAYVLEWTGAIPEGTVKAGFDSLGRAMGLADDVDVQAERDRYDTFFDFKIRASLGHEVIYY